MEAQNSNNTSQVPKSSLERVILPPQVKEDILLSLTLIENQKRIYEDWGFAEVESKYVGDAPKNLFKAFNAAKEADAVLFFDEADSFLGKRIQQLRSSDQLSQKPNAYSFRKF